MEDEARKAFHPHLNLQTQTTNNEELGGVGSSAPTQASESNQGNMEFAPLPTQHFGPPGGGSHAFDMRQMTNALPDYPFAPYAQPQQQSTVSPLAAMNQASGYPFSAQQFAGQIVSNINAQYSQPFGRGVNQQRTYNAYSQNQPLSHSPQNQSYLSQQTPMANPNQQRQMPYTGYANQQVGMYGQMQPRMSSIYQVPRVQVDSQPTSFQIPYHPGHPQIRRNSSSSSLHASPTLRGPPRKPKQSGHALWVGNLPPGTHIIDLKDHFARDATNDIESVFLISKSNCAFVNYKTEESCSAAMIRFHDSRFRGVRLVCRLRRGSSPSTAALSTAQAQPTQSSAIHASISSESKSLESTSFPDETSEIATDVTDTVLVPEKYFVVKSLTTEDLERSLQTGIWATQAHNEETLNKAFKAAENVYLIFSANKSGEYFGYARMESEIGSENANSTAEFPQETHVPASQSPVVTDVPVTIPTSATSTAPKGRIIDDSARGTIFWEAENDLLSGTQGTEEVSAGSGNASSDDNAAKSATTSQASYGKPFKIAWQSTDRLPFYRTRGLRNPWNANREVKIARDGTEIEPSIGRKLIGMFHQQAQINAANRNATHPPQYGYQQQNIPFTGMSDMSQSGYGYIPNGPGFGRPY